MNKKGFTLVELLAVMVILALITTIVATNGFGAFNNTKKAINEQNINAIKEAAKILMTDLEHCDNDLEEYKELKTYFEVPVTISSCYDLKKEIADSPNGISVDIQKFKEDYIKNDSVTSIDTDIMISYDLENDKAKLEKFYASKGTLMYISNNQGKHNTNAQTTLEFKTKSSGSISFDWKVSSESGYDKISIKLNSVYIVNNQSGIKNGSYNVLLNKDKDYKLEMIYSKDGSVNKNEDAATISNFKITAELDGKVQVTNGSYYFEESSVDN